MSSFSLLPRPFKAWRLSLLCLLLIFAVAGFWLPVHAAVTLESFEAEGRDGSVLVTWSTAQEINSAGFYVHRSTDSTGNYQRISNFIPSTGDQLIGDDYEFEDPNVTNGVTYYYWLEAVDTSNASEFFGPRSALPGVATLTPTITDTPDPSISPTITNTPGPTSTASQTPTITRTPAQAPSSTLPPSETPVPEATGTPAPTATMTASATLVPFPTVTLIYPSPSVSPAVAVESSGNNTAASPNGLLRYGLIASIIMLWILLAGWLYIFLYRGRF